MSRRKNPEREAAEIERFVCDHAGQVLIAGGLAYVLRPVLCGIEGCESFALRLDRFAPYHMEQNRCARHFDEGIAEEGER